MKRTPTLLFLIVTAITSFAQMKYPPTKMVDSAHTYFGITYHDQYGWLENMKDPAVVSWFKDQANLTNSTMSNITGRDELIADWRALDKLQPARISGRIYEGGRIFYRKTLPGQSVGKLYYRQGLMGKEVLLFDPLTYIEGKKLTLESFTPSYDGKQIAIAYSQQGAEVSTIKVMNVASRKFLADKIFPTAGLEGYTFDNKGLLYIALKTADNADPNARLNTKTRLHVIGKPASTDVDYFSNGRYPNLGIEAKAYPFVALTEDDKKYVYAGVGTVQPESIMWYAPIAQFNAANVKWKVLCTAADSLVRGMEFMNGKIYAISHDNAPNYKLLMVDAANPDWKNAKVVAQEKKDMTLEGISHSKDYLYEMYSDGVNSHIYQYAPATGATKEIKLPLSGTAWISCINKENNSSILGVTSWVQPGTEYEYNPENGTFSASKFNKAPVLPAAYKQLEVKEVLVKGHDGAMIPLSIIYKKGTKLDGNNPCLMDAYGAYGISMTPYFDYREDALAIRGAVVAIPHVRGGSEKGQAWYMGGYKTTKPNTWKDFNSCAEYLIAKGYTQKAKLAGTGTSAGGILISRAITERPDLYAAAICNVGCANAMRLEFDMNGPVNIPEFGTVKDSVECRALYEMDGVQHVVKGTKYPALICIGGWNDPRVIAWQPGKFAAAMQNASASGKPVLMKVNYDNGHFTEDKEVTWANFADQYAFAMWQCGHPDFHLKN